MKSRTQPSNRGWITSPLRGKRVCCSQWAVTTLEFQRYNINQIAAMRWFALFIEFIMKVTRSIIQYGCRCNFVTCSFHGTGVHQSVSPEQIISGERAGCFCQPSNWDGEVVVLLGFARYFRPAKARGNSESIVAVVSPLRASNKL